MSAEELLASKNRLALLNGAVEKLQFVKIDAVTTGGLHSGKEVAKDGRKQLNRRAEALHKTVIMAHATLSEALKDA